MVELYVKLDGPPCGKCEAAEEKLKRMGVAYVRFFVEERLLDAYEGWRDGGAERAAAWMMAGQPVPFFYLPVEQLGYDYPNAMRLLRSSTQRRSPRRDATSPQSGPSVI